MEPKYKRVILKISGEALAGEAKFGLNEDMLGMVAKQVKALVELGVQVAVVVGG
ncbi:MAG: UMP kinase, partial [Bacillota bacterium]